MRFAVSICALAACSAIAVAQSPTPAPAQQQEPVGTLPPYAQDTQSSPYTAQVPPDYRPAAPEEQLEGHGSTYVPVDSWIYPALYRLHSLGYLDTTFLGLRPWTRLAILHMIALSRNDIVEAQGPAAEQAQQILLAVENEFSPDLGAHGIHGEIDTTYTRFLGITNTPLNDSFHLGQTIINDYGRPYQAGVNNVSGASGRAEAGRFTLFMRGEYQHAPSATGYSQALGQYLSQTVDSIPYSPDIRQATDPVGPLPSINQFRLLEATLSLHVLNHEVSFGKTDHWWSPDQGGAFAMSNNADNIYSFQIDRAEPLYIPWFDKLFGPIRYDFFIGSLQGHTQPNAQWMHAEKISLHPTKNLEMGFERTVIFGGEGHEPVTLHTFLRSFFSTSATTPAIKYSSKDPGARYSAFDFNYRLPFLRNWVTLYTDSFAHDDVNPIDAPRRSSISPGIYLSHVPGVPALDFRVEAATTDPPVSTSNGGRFMFYEAVNQQGPTNKGFLFTNPIGREDKGGQAWITYHLSPTDHVQFSYRNVKAAKDFIPGGTTQNEYKVDFVKRFVPEMEVHIAAQYEGWKAPIYKPGLNTDTSVWGGITWYPKKQKQFF